MSTLKILVGNEQGQNPVTVLHLTGDLDGSTHKELQDKAAELVGSGTTNLLIDMSGVSYMGSAGFRALHAISNLLDGDESAGKSAHVKLLSPSAEVMKIIKTLGFDSYLDIFEDTDTAINSF